MNFTKPITYNSLSINAIGFLPTGQPSSGYLLDSFEPSNVEVAAYFEKRALRDGADASDVFFGKRRINAIVTVFGSTLGDFWDKTQDLLAAFSPTLALNANSAQLGFIPFDFYQPTADIVTWPLSAYPDGIPLRYYLRPSAPPAYVARRDSSGGVAANGMSNQYSIPLVARDPIKVSISGASSTGTTYTNNGDTPTYPFIYISATTSTGTWTGDINGAFWTVNVNGSKFTAAQASSSNVWLLDCNAGILYGPTTTGVASLATAHFKDLLPGESGSSAFRFLVRRMDRLDAASDFPTLAAGANTVTHGGSLAPAQTGVWRHAFQ